MSQASMLSPYRVLDLTDHRGEIAAQLLGDLGADVIRVEPPGGSDARRQGPLIDADGLPDTERSLPFQAFNRNKRSIVLDLGVDADRQRFMALAAGADFVFDAGPPGQLGRHGIGFEDLRAVNPRIIFTYVTPWGDDGPAAGRPASDLTLAAMGGSVALQGAPDRAPVRVTVPQVWRHAGAEAGAAALIAHRRMQVTGEAQYVDLSAQCAVTWTTMNAMDAWAVQGFDFQRSGSVVQMGTREVDPVFACADGYLVALPAGTVVEPLLGHLLAGEFVDESWLAEDWTSFDQRLFLGEPTLFSREDVRGMFERFFAAHTKAELFAIGLETGVTLAPVNTAADLLHFEQLSARQAWHQVELPDGRNVTAPGRIALPTATSLHTRRRAPRLDEHGDEIRAEAARAPAPVEHIPNETGRPFDGLNVLDLTWVIAGPASVRQLSDHGAKVVKVESELRPDGLRLLGPVRGEEGSWNRSHFYGEFNAGKQCIQLNLKAPLAVEILKRLIVWADVFVENWAPGALGRLGLAPETCMQLNPKLIMVSTSLMGQTGPAAGVAGYGYHAGGMAGFYEVTGWPDRPPAGPWMAYTDVIAPRYIAAMVTAALDHRRRTGEGQHIDAAQFEMALQFLAPEIMDVQTSGYVATRLGNRARDAAPQGVYPCLGEDQWCAIAVDDDAQWQALKSVLGNPEWAADAALDSVAGRLAAHDEIDARLASWTADQDRYELMDRLCAAGVPAGAVQRSSDTAKDPQYLHRKFHRWHEHPEMGRVPYAGVQYRIRGYEPGPYHPAPLLGEHTERVLREELGMTEAEIEAAAAAGALK